MDILLAQLRRITMEPHVLASNVKYNQLSKRQQGQENDLVNIDFAVSELTVIEFRSSEGNEQTDFFLRPDVGMKLTKLCNEVVFHSTQVTCFQSSFLSHIDLLHAALVTLFL